VAGSIRPPRSPWRNATVFRSMHSRFRYGQRHERRFEAADASPARSRSPTKCEFDLRRFRGLGTHGPISPCRRPDRGARWSGHPGDVCAARKYDLLCRSRSPGPRRWARTTSSSASTRWTIAATRTAARSTIAAFQQLADLATRGGRRGTETAADPYSPHSAFQEGHHRDGAVARRPTTRSR